jgi:ankyrin repeat protein
MCSVNDENELKKCLNEIISIIEETVLEESSFTNETNSNKKKLEELTNIINVELKNSLALLSDQYRQYFLYLFKDYHYSFDKGTFNETIKRYILKELLDDLHAIRDSFDAFQAAFDGNLSIVRHFIEKYPKYKDKCGIWGTTLLYSAARNNHSHIVKYLIEQGNCFVNVQNISLSKQLNPTSGSTPLHAACFYGHLNIVKYLIDNNADYFIENDAKETPIYNGLLRENISEFFQDYLIFSYTNSMNNVPQSTILNENRIICDSIWEYKSLYSDQWILFDQNQSNQLQQSLIYQPNKNYNQNLMIPINNQCFSISIIQFLCFTQPDKEYLWIRTRGSSILNFNSYEKWQIMFQNDPPSKMNKTISLDVFNIDDNPNIKIKIKCNHWYNVHDYLQQQLENAMNYRKKYLNISLPFIDDHLFQFNLKTFSFSNQNNTISGFIRWIPIFIQNNDQTIIDNFQPLNNLFLIPKYRTHSTDQLTTACNYQNHYAVSYILFFSRTN